MIWRGRSLSQTSPWTARVDAVRDVLQSRWLDRAGAEELEAAFARTRCRTCVCSLERTAALHIAHAVLGIGSGDEVITPSLTFVATANSVLYCGARPVFADIAGPDDLNVAWEEIAAKITPETRAITVVHYGGYPCDMQPILDLAAITTSGSSRMRRMRSVRPTGGRSAAPSGKSGASASLQTRTSPPAKEAWS